MWGSNGVILELFGVLGVLFEVLLVFGGPIWGITSNSEPIFDQIGEARHQFWVPFGDLVACVETFRATWGAPWLLWSVEGGSVGIFGTFFDAKGRLLSWQNVAKVL